MSQRFRKSAAITPAVVNPLLNDTIDLTVLEWIKIIIFSVTLAPIRLILIVFLLLLCYICVKVALFGKDMDDILTKPLSRKRRAILSIVKILARIVLFVFGVYWIDVKGRKASMRDAPIIVCNHVSFFDFFFFAAEELPRFLSRKENLQVPIIGACMLALQTILVDRNDKDSKRKAVQAIKDHTEMTKETDGWGRLLIFAEGTCTNQKALITFKTGAFLPGAPVQPVAISYPFINYDPSWVLGVNPLILVWRSLCQVQNHMRVQYLPVHTPSPEEISDPVAFASNVRERIARALNIPVTEHSWEDVMFQSEALKLHLPPAAMSTLEQKTLREHGSAEEIKSMLKKFSQMDKDRDGELNMEEFAEALNLPVSQYIQHLFNMMDTDDSGTISWREYVSGALFLSKELANEERIRLTFELFDKGKSGNIKFNEFVMLMHQIYPGTDSKMAEGLFRKADVNDDGVIDYDDFVAFLKSNPEYLSIINDYTEKGGPGWVGSHAIRFAHEEKQKKIRRKAQLRRTIVGLVVAALFAYYHFFFQ
eukprot:TRINITY_DN17800_c0_g1_i1.p1 TRINITY_DN17800_c0_g1~~TRINITY_DN17800_c0_g1_i1.p1  ORF type:complete len:566 (+),score=64.74 TRINITY_DN17800_c0_g1_i1:91-1698(+)